MGTSGKWVIAMVITHFGCKCPEWVITRLTNTLLSTRSPLEVGVWDTVLPRDVVANPTRPVPRMVGAQACIWGRLFVWGT